MRKLIYADDISERLEMVIRIGGKAPDGEHPISAECVLSVLESLPTVDAAPVRHGRWIRHDYADIVDGYYVPKYECSECKNWVKDDTDFCPNCGTKMDGKDGDHHD